MYITVWCIYPNVTCKVSGMRAFRCGDHHKEKKFTVLRVTSVKLSVAYSSSTSVDPDPSSAFRSRAGSIEGYTSSFLYALYTVARLSSMSKG